MSEVEAQSGRVRMCLLLLPLRQFRCCCGGMTEREMVVADTVSVSPSSGIEIGMGRQSIRMTSLPPPPLLMGTTKVHNRQAMMKQTKTTWNGGGESNLDHHHHPSSSTETETETETELGDVRLGWQQHHDASAWKRARCTEDHTKTDSALDLKRTGRRCSLDTSLSHWSNLANPSTL